MKRRILAVGALLLLGSRPATAQVSVELLGGTALSLPTQLSIRQTGQPDIKFTAHYSTKPWEDTPYYSIKMGLWKGNKGWMLGFIHHKLYLDNPPPEVQWFRITYGFNIFTVGRGWRKGNFVYSVSLGPVVTHAFNSVRGRQHLGRGGPFNKGYTLSGGTVTGSAQYRLGLGAASYLALQALLSTSYIEVPVSGGTAHVPNAALHLNVGVGHSF